MWKSQAMSGSYLTHGRWCYCSKVASFFSVRQHFIFIATLNLCFNTLITVESAYFITFRMSLTENLRNKKYAQEEQMWVAAVGGTKTRFFLALYSSLTFLSVNKINAKNAWDNLETWVHHMIHKLAKKKKWKKFIEFDDHLSWWFQIIVWFKSFSPIFVVDIQRLQWMFN